jgi:hypothetical protein
MQYTLHIMQICPISILYLYFQSNILCFMKRQHTQKIRICNTYICIYIPHCKPFGISMKWIVHEKLLFSKMSTKKYICKPQYSVFHEVFTNMGLLHMANKRHFKALCPFSIQQPHVLPTITLWYTTKVNKCNTYLNTLHTKKNKCFTYACVRKYTKIYMHKI